MMSRGVSPLSADDATTPSWAVEGASMTGPSDEHLSVHDAVERYDIPVRTLTRLLRDGQLPGAYTVSGPRGEE